MNYKTDGKIMRGTREGVGRGMFLTMENSK